ncbi:MAG: DUF3108 domain-containing protein [Acidobacteria bacterium]|nr:DUF3108 domain-containing protein [Acidobacteriota bacterium]MBV9068680.1 DUF3108 domain-containing protein [Acidobacteriota bacterium]MBV9188135.1 DUF3108 domain-containing protein [Acidobacteriota bacterium]
MKPTRYAILALVIACAIPTASAVELNCRGPANVESFKYSWKLRGGLSWIAGIMFPTSGIGELKTTYPAAGRNAIDSSLLITAPAGKSGFYAYETQIEASGQRTLMTYHAYSWKDKSRKERTLFDYNAGLARMHKETPEKQWDKIDHIPAGAFHDVVSAIYYLRANAATIRGPVATQIYSDGKSYPVIVRPANRQMFTIGGQQIGASGFEIVDGPGGKKWPGGMKIWLSDDARRIPFRIEIIQSMASLQLDLQSIDSCAFMQAAK